MTTTSQAATLCGFKEIASFLQELTGVSFAERTVREYAAVNHPTAGRLPVIPIGRWVTAQRNQVQAWALRRWPKLKLKHVER